MTMQRGDIQFANSEFLPEVIKLLNAGHTVVIRLKGFSMRPFLEDGRDKALLRKPATIAVGDPVLCEIEQGSFVLHRIIDIKDDDITLRGDGNLATEHCKRKNVVGAVVGFYRKGRQRLDRVEGKKWKVYSYLWMTLFPIRRYLLGIYRRLWIPVFGPI